VGINRRGRAVALERRFDLRVVVGYSARGQATVLDEGPAAALLSRRNPVTGKRALGRAAGKVAAPDGQYSLVDAQRRGEELCHHRGLSVLERRARGPRPTTGGPMPTFIMLTTLTPEGVQTVKNNPQRIKEVSKEIEQLGATVKAQYATLGHFDFVNVVEAPDETTMAKVSLELGSRGTAKYETLTAIPIDDFISAL